MTKKTISHIYTLFKPNGLAVSGDVFELKKDIGRTNLLIYGETHGAIENAHTVYSLIQQLDIKQLGVECDTKTAEVMLKISEGKGSVEEVDSDIFDSSIVSIEMLKTIIMAKKLGYIEKIIPLDTFYDTEHLKLNSKTPQEREIMLATNIQQIKLTSKTMCIMGSWHTKGKIVPASEQGSTPEHVSAYLRIKKNMPEVTLLEVNYGSGTIFNCGEYIEIPESKTKSQTGLSRMKPHVYKLYILNATPIQEFPKIRS